MSLPEFIVDSRETNSGIPATLQAAGLKFTMSELAAGDYSFGDFLIERKSVVDFAASILDGRLFEQAEAMTLASTNPMLLIEGDLSRVPNALSDDVLVGAISAIKVFYGLSCLCTPNAATTARLLARMFKHLTEGLGYEIATRVKKPAENPDGALSQFLVCGLPGVGPEGARKLLMHFGSAREVFAASVTELKGCKGIGPKTAEAIVAALDRKPTAFRSTKLAPSSRL